MRGGRGARRGTTRRNGSERDKRPWLSLRAVMVAVPTLALFVAVAVVVSLHVTALTATQDRISLAMNRAFAASTAARVEHRFEQLAATMRAVAASVRTLPSLALPSDEELQGTAALSSDQGFPREAVAAYDSQGRVVASAAPPRSTPTLAAVTNRLEAAVRQATSELRTINVIFADGSANAVAVDSAAASSTAASRTVASYSESRFAQNRRQASVRSEWVSIALGTDVTGAAVPSHVRGLATSINGTSVTDARLQNNFLAEGPSYASLVEQLLTAADSFADNASSASQIGSAALPTWLGDPVVDNAGSVFAAVALPIFNGTDLVGAGRLDAAFDSMDLILRDDACSGCTAYLLTSGWFVLAASDPNSPPPVVDQALAALDESNCRPLTGDRDHCQLAATVYPDWRLRRAASDSDLRARVFRLRMDPTLAEAAELDLGDGETAVFVPIRSPGQNLGAIAVTFARPSQDIADVANRGRTRGYAASAGIAVCAALVTAAVMLAVVAPVGTMARRMRWTARLKHISGGYGAGANPNASDGDDDGDDAVGLLAPSTHDEGPADEDRTPRTAAANDSPHDDSDGVEMQPRARRGGSKYGDGSRMQGRRGSKGSSGAAAADTARPTDGVTAKSRHASDGHRSVLAEINDLQLALEGMTAAIANCARYVPLSAMRQLIRDGRLEDATLWRVPGTVFYSALEGFGAIAARGSAAEIVSLLRSYTGVVQAAVSEHDGVVDNVRGDTVTAVWSMQRRITNHAVKATLAALLVAFGCSTWETPATVAALRDAQPPPSATPRGSVSSRRRQKGVDQQQMLQEQRAAAAAQVEGHRRALQTAKTAAGDSGMLARVGIASGQLVGGDVGSESRVSVHVMGAAVGAARRLLQLAPRDGARVLAAHSTVAQLPRCFACALTGAIDVSDQEPAGFDAAPFSMHQSGPGAAGAGGPLSEEGYPVEPLSGRSASNSTLGGRAAHGIRRASLLVRSEASEGGGPRLRSPTGSLGQAGEGPPHVQGGPALTYDALRGAATDANGNGNATSIVTAAAAGPDVSVLLADLLMPSYAVVGVGSLTSEDAETLAWLDRFQPQAAARTTMNDMAADPHAVPKEQAFTQGDHHQHETQDATTVSFTSHDESTTMEAMSSRRGTNAASPTNTSGSQSRGFLHSSAGIVGGSASARALVVEMVRRDSAAFFVTPSQAAAAAQVSQASAALLTGNPTRAVSLLQCVETASPTQPSDQVFSGEVAADQPSGWGRAEASFGASSEAGDGAGSPMSCPLLADVIGALRRAAVDAVRTSAAASAQGRASGTASPVTGNAASPSSARRPYSSRGSATTPVAASPTVAQYSGNAPNTDPSDQSRASASPASPLELSQQPSASAMPSVDIDPSAAQRGGPGVPSPAVLHAAPRSDNEPSDLDDSGSDSDRGAAEMP